MPTDTQDQTERKDAPLELFTRGDDGEIRPAFTFTRIGIEIPEDLTYPEWERGLALFKAGEEHFKIGRANYISYGERKFGLSVVRDALTQYEFDLPIVTEALRIGSIPEAVRHPQLTSEHYVVLAKAGLNKKELKRWAAAAAAQNLAPSTLKVSIEHGEVISPQTAKKYTSGQLTIHGLMHEFRILKERVGGVGGVLAMSEAGRNEWLNEMREAVEFYNAINAALFAAEEALQFPGPDAQIGRTEDEIDAA